MYFGKVRATGSTIRGFEGAAGGVIRWIKLVNDTAVAVDQLGMSKEELQTEQQALQKTYDVYCAKGLKLDMSRGKPCAQQLDLSMDLLKIQQTTAENGMDLRNYGCLEGIPEARRLFAQLLGTSEELTMVGGNSSLNLMFEVIGIGCRDGFGGEAWGYTLKKQRKLAVFCMSNYE